MRCTLSSQRFRCLRRLMPRPLPRPVGWLISPPAHSLRLQLVSKWDTLPTNYPIPHQLGEHQTQTPCYRGSCLMRPQVPPIPIEIKHSCVHENGAPYKKLEVRTSQPTILNTFTITGVEENMEVLYCKDEYQPECPKSPL